MIERARTGERIKRMLSWERSILVLSFWFAVVIFVVALLWGNAAHFIQGHGAIGLQDAALWFAKAFMLSAMVGTVVNLLGLLILLAVDGVRRP